MPDQYDDLTIYGIVDLHKARSEGTGGEPRTIRDHLLLDGINDMPLLTTLYRQIYMGLKEDGEFHHLLGSVYLLSQRRGGRQPEGFGDEPPRGHDKLKPDLSKALTVQEYRAIAERDHTFAGTSAAIRTSALATAALRSRRQQEKIIGGPLAQEGENAYLRQENDHLHEKVGFLERELEMYRTGRVPSAAALTDGRARGRAPVPVPTNGNGGTHA